MQTLATEGRGVAQRFWQMSLVRGVVLIIFGILAIVWPHLTFRLFFLIFGIFAIVEGVVLVINAFVHRKESKVAYQGSQGSSFYRRADPGATYQQGGTYGQTGPAQGGVPYQQTGPAQGSPTYGQAGPAQGGVPYQQAEPFQGGTGYEAEQARGRPGYGQGEPVQGGATRGQAGQTRGSADYQRTETGGAHGLHAPEWAAMAYRARGGQRSWGISLVEGLFTIICGILCLILPTFVAALAVYVVAAWAMFKGIGALMQIQHHGWVMGVIGVLAIIMSLFLFIDPLGAIRTFLWGVGVFALIMGVMLVVRGIQHNASLRQAAPPPEPSY